MKATLLSAVLLLALAASGVCAPTPAPTPTPAASPTPAPTPALALTEIAPQAQTKLAALNACEPDNTPDKIADAARSAFRDLTGRADALVYQSGKISAPGPTSSLDALRDQLAAWKKLQENLDDQIRLLGTRGADLENEARDIDETQKLWQGIQAAAVKDANAPPEIRSTVYDVLAAAADARRRVDARRSAVLSLQTTFNDVGTRVAAGLAKAQSANAEAVKTLFVPDSPPLWTHNGQPAPDFFARWRESTGEQFNQLRAYSRLHGDYFAVQAGIFVVLLALMYWLRGRVARWTEDEPHLTRAAPIFRIPVATALVLSFVFKGNLYAGTPPLFRVWLGMVALVPTIIILRRLLDPRLGLVLWSLAGFYATDSLRLATVAFPATNRWIFCVELAAAIAVFALLSRLQRTVHPKGGASLGKAIFALDALAILVLSAALGASVFGYMRLGALLGDATLFSAYLAVGLYALLRVIEGLIVIILRVRPATASHVVQKHRNLLQDRAYRAFRFAAYALWLAATLDRLQLFVPLYEGTLALLDQRLPLGAAHVTPGSILAFGLAIWASVMLSRALRFFLDEEIYERVQLAPGLPYAISTILNYSILIVGFMVALGVLGVPLTQFTVVAGALSVGLGFGLQNIINNFVSGIILLFERPVKVGDVIQLGDAVGEVRRIGIRASIVRMRDGSDVILPNGNLISNQVINWTYADRSRALEIPLNLAAGQDYGQAVEMLRAAVTEQPGAQGRPEPSVFVTAVGGTGCSVVVRVWTDQYEDWMKVRSDLTVKLADALARENVRLA